MRFGVALVACLSLLCAPSALSQAPAIPALPSGSPPLGGTAAMLSSGVDFVVTNLRNAPRDLPFAIVVDVPSLPAADVQRVLYALLDRRTRGGQTVAVASEARGGAAIVALACDGLVALGTAPVEGVGADWCDSPAQLADIADDFRTLSRLPYAMADRFFTTQGPLGWTAGAGMQTDGSGTIRFADPGQPLRTNSTDLRTIGAAVEELKSMADALKAISDGMVALRNTVQHGGAGLGSGTQPAGVPAGTQPPGLPPPGLPPPGTPSGTPSGTPAGTSPPSPPPVVPPGAPIAVPPPPTVPAAPKPPAAPASPAVDPKLAPKVAEYAEELAQLKKLAAEFDEYYRGTRGFWSSQHDSLKEVWDAKADHTLHGDTRLACERLQRSMKESIRRLESDAKSIARIANDASNPEVVRTKANAAVLEAFRSALERNRTSNYDQNFPLLMRLK